jgi:integrase
MLAYSEQHSRRDLHFALFTMYLTGARPSEIKSAMFDFAAEHAYVTLACAKEKFNERNSRLRTLAFDRSDRVINRRLREVELWVAEQEVIHPFRHLKSADLNNLCRRISQKLWRGQVLVNPSCFRCLFIADLKKDGISRGIIADQVGHTAIKSASRYGTAQQGLKGRRSYLYVEQNDEQEILATRPKG